MAIISKDNKVMITQRSGMMGHSPNAWVLPGGHLEVHESFEHGICREIAEETGLVINES